MSLGYESVTLNIDVMVYIAVLRTVTDGDKERKLLVSNNLAGYPAEHPAPARPLDSTVRLRPASTGKPS